MNVYEKELLSIIEKELNNRKTAQFIRVDYFNKPEIYLNIAEKLSEKYPNLNILLAEEKYDYWKKLNQDEAILDELMSRSYIDINTRLTKLRNNFGTEKQSYVLFGTEAVQDKGGLADFFEITPNDIEKSVNNNFAKWFNCVDQESSSEVLKVNNLFKAIFSNVPLDITKVSDISKVADEKNILDTSELLNYIVQNLWFYFQLPNFKEVSNEMRRDLEKKKMVSLINLAAKFIKREDYKKGLTPIAKKKIESKFNVFEEENKTDYISDIEGKFGNLKKMKEDLISFALGENISIMRAKFATFDFNIIAHILGIKETISTKKDTLVKFKGDPLEAYSLMLFNFLLNKTFYKNLDSINISIRIESITLADATLDEEKNKRWKEICIALGGIVDYINVGLNKVNLSYDNEDIFSTQNLNDSIVDFEGANKLSKINFILKSEDIEGSSKMQRYQWSFNSFDYWLQTFNLIPLYYEQINEKMTEVLPIFSCNQIGNLLTSTDTETYHFQKRSYEILMHNYWDEIKRLAANESIIFTKMYPLAKIFPLFLKEVSDSGFYNYINIHNNTSFSKYIDQYAESLESLYKNYDNFGEVEKEYLYPITNLFAIVEKKEEAMKLTKIKGAIIPPLHPAMLEKIEAQQFFRRQGLDEIIDEIFAGKIVKELHSREKFYNIMQQSSIISGVDTLITENLSRVPNKVLGYYALHGNAEDGIIDSSNLLDISTDFEEDEEDVSLSAKSNIIKDHIYQYMKIFPSNVDAMNVAFVNFDYLLPIIEVVKSFVKNAENTVKKVNYTIHILSEKLDFKSQNYMRVWLEKNFTEDDNFKLNVYFNTFDEINENIEEFDLVFIENLMETIEIKYSKGNDKKINLDETKYPMVFNPMANSRRDGTRNISVSQMQFIASFAHSQLVFWLENETAQANVLYNVEKVLKLREPVENLLDFYHDHAHWVVSIDTGLDKAIYKDENIISFSTGEGAYGELNVAISTSEKIRVDIMQRLQKRLRKLFPSWQDDLYEQACQYILSQLANVDGIKVLKALNPNDYEVHSFLASILATHSLNIQSIEEDVILKSFISLDSYNHWFNEEPNRPDFLELQVKEIDGKTKKIVIEANLVECKMGKENSEHISKGLTQLTNGLAFLREIFSPESKEYNRRYWYAQLYRLLAFSPNYLTNDVTQKELLNIHLMKILNAEFEIHWNTTLLTYWLDINDEVMPNKQLYLDIVGERATHKAYGQLYIQKHLLPQEKREIVSYDKEIFNESTNFADDEDSFNEILENNRNYDFEDDYCEVLPHFSKKQNTVSQVDSTEELHENAQTVEDSKNLKNPSDGREEEVNLEISTNNQKKETENNSINTKMTQSEPIVDGTPKKLEDMRVLLGKDSRGKEHYWEFGHPKLENRHLLISGKSGVGKTYFMQCLLMELANNNISSLIFDYTDGFKKSKLEKEFKEQLGDRLVQFHVMRNGFPINPFKKNKKEIDEGEYIDENDVDVAERIKSVFTAVYKSKGMGDQQANAIYRASLNGLKKYKDQMNLEFLRSELESMGESQAKTVLAKIEPLLDREPFDTNSEYNWEEHRKQEGIVFVVQLSGFTREVQLIITEFILWDLWNFNLSHGSVQKPFPVILDEAQNLDHSESSPSAKILTEGRKFGWSGWYATQFMDGQMNKDEIRRLQNASQRVYFQPPDDETKSIASILSTDSGERKEWEAKLSKLGKGRCIISGPSLQDGTDQLQYLKPRVISVTPLIERIK